MQWTQQTIPSHLELSAHVLSYKPGEPTLRKTMSGIKRHTVLVLNSRVELALHIVHRLWHQVQSQFLVSEKVVQKT